jgi:hypothetical protein
VTIADYDFSTTRNNIIKRALRLVGALHEGETISAYQTENGVEALNQIVKAWQNKHVFLWTERTEEIPLVVGQARYPMQTDPAWLSIDMAFFRKNNVDTLIRRLSWAEYQEIEEKTDTGEPYYLTVDPNPADNDIVLWPVPDAADDIFVKGIIRLEDFDTAGQTGVLSSNWELALTYALAFDLSFEYGIPNAEKDRLEKRADTLFFEAKSGEKKQVTSDEEFVTSAFSRVRRR